MPDNEKSLEEFHTLTFAQGRVLAEFHRLTNKALCRNQGPATQLAICKEIKSLGEKFDINILIKFANISPTFANFCAYENLTAFWNEIWSLQGRYPSVEMDESGLLKIPDDYRRLKPQRDAFGSVRGTFYYGLGVKFSNNGDSANALEAWEKAAFYQNFSAFVALANHYYQELEVLPTSDQARGDALIDKIEKHWRSAFIHGVPAFFEYAVAWIRFSGYHSKREDFSEMEAAWKNVLIYLYVVKECEENSDQEFQEKLQLSKYNAYWGLSLSEYYSQIKSAESAICIDDWLVSFEDLKDISQLIEKFIEKTEISLSAQQRARHLAKDIVSEYKNTLIPPTPVPAPGLN